MSSDARSGREVVYTEHPLDAPKISHPLFFCFHGHGINNDRFKKCSKEKSNTLDHIPVHSLYETHQ